MLRWVPIRVPTILAVPSVVGQVNDDGVPWAAVAPLAVLAIAFVAYCLIDLVRSDVKHLPKWAWAAICIASVPIGGIVYLLFGRTEGGRRDSDP